MTITVYGLPAPQGSKSFKGMSKKGHAILAESSKAVKPWRRAVEFAVMDMAPLGGRKDPILFRGPVTLHIVFSFARPKSAKNRKYPCVSPDLSKLIRSTEDALTIAGVWEDDSRVVSETAHKRYAGDPDALSLPGAVIAVERAT